jgi:DNA primase
LQINDTIINADLDEVLQELKTQLAYQQLPYLQKTQDSGKDIMVQCPFHGNGQERRPSAGIRKSDGMFHCFACHEVHTLPEVISFVFGSDDVFGQYGMKWLLKNFGTVQVEDRKDVEIDMARNNVTRKNTVLGSSDSDKPQWVSEEELDSYRYYHKYWSERGITDDNIIELFDLGYDKETDSITFPVRDVYGHCLFVARRNVKSKVFNYPKGVEKPLYGLYELAQHWIEYEVEEHIEDGTIGMNKGKDVFITESMIDCILLWQAGHYAVALNGTGSELQYEQLRKLPIRHLILATDNDKAGRLAKDKIRKNVPNKLITEIEFPEDIKDVGDLGKAKRFNDIKNIKNWEVL